MGRTLLPPLTLFSRRCDEHKLVADLIRKSNGSDQPVKILEAGCGRQWPIDLTSLNFHLTGIDSDAQALAHRQKTVGDLDEAMVANLCEASFNEDSFDVIYCAFVLEHVAAADRVRVNFSHWLRPGGWLVLKVPDHTTVYGFCAKHTPFWIHLCYYRWVLGHKQAGRPGYCPYPTYYHPVISRDGIRTLCDEEPALFRLSDEYGDGYKRDGKGVFKAAIQGVKWLVALCSLGKLSARHSNVLFLMQKPG